MKYRIDTQWPRGIPSSWCIVEGVLDTIVPNAVNLVAALVGLFGDQAECCQVTVSKVTHRGKRYKNVGAVISDGNHVKWQWQESTSDE